MEITLKLFCEIKIQNCLAELEKPVILSLVWKFLEKIWNR